MGESGLGMQRWTIGPCPCHFIRLFWTQQLSTFAPEVSKRSQRFTLFGIIASFYCWLSSPGSKVSRAKEVKLWGIFERERTQEEEPEGEE